MVLITVKKIKIKNTKTQTILNYFLLKHTKLTPTV